MENEKLYEVGCQIHKVLVNIAMSLEALAKVARAEHPEAFKRQERPPVPPPRSSAKSLLKEISLMLGSTA